jgi:two-component system, NarL family, sensor histidine kinase DevS
LDQGPRDAQASGLRAQLLEVTSKIADVLGFQPRVRFTGPVDAGVPPEVSVHLVAVVREALSNVTRHAQASSVEVMVHAGTDIVLTVRDDGRGMGATTRRSGLANLEGRAKVLGGTCTVTSEEGTGTCLEWRVPAHRTPFAGGVADGTITS